jgi:hypothetical protein
MTKKTEDKKPILQLVSVDLTDDARALLLQELQLEKRCIDNRLRAAVASQEVFRKDKTRRFLLTATRAKITRLKVKWAEDHPDIGAGYRVLQDLESVKFAAEKNRHLIRLAKDPLTTVPAYELIWFMFDVVQNAMHRQQWGDLVPAAVVGIQDGQGVTTIEATI